MAYEFEFGSQHDEAAFVDEAIASGCSVVAEFERALEAERYHVVGDSSSWRFVPFAEPLATSSVVEDEPVLTRRKDETLSEFIAEWRESPEWEAYGDNTKRTHVRSLRVIEAVWGDVTLEAFDDPLAHSALRRWQETLVHKPATADNYFGVLSSVLSFGVARRRLHDNFAIGIPDLYNIGRRAAIVWTLEDVKIFVQTAEKLGLPTVGDAVLLAFETGLRPEDLITIRTDNIFDYEVTKRALKTSRFGNRYYATIPRTEDLNIAISRCLARFRQDGVSTLLVKNNGEPFRDFQLENAVRLVRRKCGIHYVDPATGQREEKLLRDLRGTFATRLLATTDLTDKEVADVMAWCPRWVARIRRVYVDDLIHIEAIGRRWQSRAADSAIGFVL